jgi:hypothetical protein
LDGGLLLNRNPLCPAPIRGKSLYFFWDFLSDFVASVFSFLSLFAAELSPPAAAESAEPLLEPLRA